MKRSSWHLRAGSVVFGWLVALVVVAVAQPFLPLSSWLLVHLLGLGAASNAILIWSRHFADALLRRSPDPPYPGQVIRLLVFNVGAVTVITGMLGGWWPVVSVGGIAVAAVALVHAVDLVRFLRVALPARFSVTVHYYVAAAALLAVGAGLGVAMANSALPGILAERFRTAHTVLNLFGWVGLTVLGTLVTLWPTMLRTRLADGVERAARRGLPALVLSLAIAVAGAILGSAQIIGAGALGFLASVGFVLWPHIDEVRRKRPADFPTLSVLCGVAWLLGSLAYLTVGLLTAPNWIAASDRASAAGPALLAGFLVQVLFGSLAYLVPMVMGGRASALAASAVLEKGAPWRLSVANSGLLICVLPVPGLVRVATSALVLVAYGAFLPLLARAAWFAQRNSGVPSTPGRPEPAPLRQRLGVAAAGFGVVILAVAAGVAVDPATRESATAPEVSPAPTGHTSEVEVRVEGMRYVPDTISVAAGDRLRITFDNTGTDRHDLVLSNGARTDRIAPGVTAVLDAGVIGSDVHGWCSIAGHRQMGMTLTIKAIGTAPVGGPEHDPAAHAPDVSLTAPGIARSLGTLPGPGFAARDPNLPAAGIVDRRVTLKVTEVEREVSPGITQRLWTFGGTAPGPTLRGRIGDVFEITLINDGTIGHSIDFHAGSLAPDRPMRTIEPGEQLVYRFTATRAGVWLYHCASMPMSVHVANGMFGAVIIDPPGLPPVDREYLIVQSELYLGARGGEADAAKVAADTPDLVVFNGYAQQYDHAPLTARVGDRVRFWVLAAGPNRGTAFHVVGGQFDSVWAEGAYRLRPGGGGSQTLGLFPSQGGFAELSFPEPGNYPFVSHAMVDADRGAHGVVEVRE
ncbi:multicopper oxidase domain-containing protein [Mycolicibacterium pyrenivorans]|uniref:multicopper oxidase domain-containing protein n=1 Tax=Mycolicibacterium pyrenivorans TaxID=187102 RepID=UPI0021F2C26B|nr:multicopper oxidase domain-containing protein [Mycolicibacterium pyrenivorans]MCV7151046.1 multicopper oxidase domain-containing protein [Mycolicibacterium pyrenivorans]